MALIRVDQIGIQEKHKQRDKCDIFYRFLYLTQRISKSLQAFTKSYLYQRPKEEKIYEARNHPLTVKKKINKKANSSNWTNTKLRAKAMKARREKCN